MRRSTWCAGVEHAFDGAPYFFIKKLQLFTLFVIILTMFSMGRSRKTREPSSTENTPVKKKSRAESGMDDNAMSQSFRLTDNMTMPAPSPSPSASRSLEAQPNWFVEFEAWQEPRFESLFKECREAHAAFDHDMKKLKAQDSKLDGMENRNRLNNIVIFNVPEGFEGDNCMTFIQKLIKDKWNLIYI